MKSVLLALPLAEAHYGKPPCAADETEGQISDGQVACLPKCGTDRSCPTDVALAQTAKPECALVDNASHQHFCGLVCSSDSQCDSGHCDILQQTVGICTYASSSSALGATSFSTVYHPVDTEGDHRRAWAEHMAKYGKTYASKEEEAVRFEVYKQNRIYISMQNRDLDYELGENEFADLTNAEFQALYTNGFRPALREQWGELPYLGSHQYSGKALDDSVDWTDKGAVTPVKNQGQCGSCWSFSTTGSLEGAWEIAGHKLVAISEQQLVDCDKVDNGCSGGLMDNAFKYAEANSMCTEASYPYTGKRGTCQADSCDVAVPKGSVTGFKDVDPDDEQAMMEAIGKGPVSIAIEADKTVFQFYKGGVLTATCGDQLDHGVLAVGYGELDGKKYWKVKNSWGPSWGKDGFILLARGDSSKQAGECGLLKQPSYPVVTAAGDAQVLV